MRTVDITSRRLALMAAASALALCSPALAQEDEGFAISVEGKTIAGDQRLGQSARRAEQARINADIQVKADGLGVRPRLELVVTAAEPGQIALQSRVNYPAWVVRGEVRLFSPKTASPVQVIPLASNAALTMALPEKGMVATYRVYDAAGRYDETGVITFDHPQDSTAEAGIDAAVRRRIPVVGGAVTVSGTGLASGARISTLGETFAADPSGAFVMQRILPTGDHAISVSVSGGGAPIDFAQVINIPKSEWFTIATADLTYGIKTRGIDKGDTYTSGRLAYYTKGKTATGWNITSSADTGEAPLGDLFRDFDRKDPQGVLARMDPDLAYPVYGDGSTLENDAPTNGKFYLKAERDGSHLTWGNYKAELSGSQYLRNERSLYGAEGVFRSPAQTPQGEPRFSATLYAAQPDNLPGREVFLGTGGSVYFLHKQDISIGSETLTVELRDPVTGRVIGQRSLAAGRDYQINYLQGVITLAAPLSGFVSGGMISPEAGSRPEARLVAQYEYTPTAADISGFAFGGRVEGWVSDQLRLGVTGMVDRTDTADQRAQGADLRYTFGSDSFAEAEIARTDGPGFGQSYSADGGLIVSSAGATGGTGDAYRFKTEVDFGDLGLADKGRVSAYLEHRNAGFSTLDYQTTADEALWGISVSGDAGPDLKYTLAYDAFDADNGRKLNEGNAEISYQQNDRLTWGLALNHEDRNEPGVATKTGARTDAALRLTVTESDALQWYVFGQATVARDAGRLRNDRAGAGATVDLGRGWGLEGEISHGTAGPGGRAILRYAHGNNTAYAGYVLDPGRELDGLSLIGRDAGQLVAGGKQALNGSTDLTAENTYDMFGQHKSLLSTYGVEYRPSEFLAFTGGVELGQVRDGAGDFDRKGLSFGLRYQDESGLSAKARLELRRDRGQTAGTPRDADTLHLTADASYQVDDARKWLLSLDAADAKTDGSSVLSGTYAKASLGYAFRPVDNDRLNLLARYTYLYDMYGQRINGTDAPGPRQKSHVLSLDATYDLNPQWELGGKIGFRLSQSAPDSATPLARNDAVLGVLNARYHLTYKWDLLVEGRYLAAHQAGLSEYGVLATVYRHVGDHLMVGLGYNAGRFTDDLTDLSLNNQGVFLNLIGKF